MNVLVVGSGGREHALAWKLLARERTGQVLCAPGNAGTALLATSIEADPLDFPALATAALTHGVALTIVGPEAPLAAGIVDYFEGAGLKIFGPTRDAAQLESSKAWAKEQLLAAGIPTARAEVVESAQRARATLAAFGYPAVIKADGLASGKGVWVVQDARQADEAIEALFERKALGAAADRVLVEQHLAGRELSVLCFTDGERLAMMPPARDYKRLLDGDGGPNTGGMGGYTRPVDATSELLDEVAERILRPILQRMDTIGAPYRGVLYAGLMLTADGPFVLEFNCRFGDPEAQLLLPLLESDLAEVCQAVAEGCLDPDRIHWSQDATCGVVLAAERYPTEPRLGDEIKGIEALDAGVCAFHGGTAYRARAGTPHRGERELVTSGGRVLTVVAAGPTVAAARERAYANAARIDFRGQQMRGDIGLEAAGPLPWRRTIAAGEERTSGRG